MTTTVPDRTAVQIKSCPCAGGEGVGSPRSGPSGVSLIGPHWMPASTRTTSTDSPTVSLKVWPESDEVSCITTEPVPEPVPEAVVVVGAAGVVGVVTVGDAVNGATVVEVAGTTEIAGPIVRLGTEAVEEPLGDDPVATALS